MLPRCRLGLTCLSTSPGTWSYLLNICGIAVFHCFSDAAFMTACFHARSSDTPHYANLPTPESWNSVLTTATLLGWLLKSWNLKTGRQMWAWSYPMLPSVDCKAVGETFGDSSKAHGDGYEAIHSFGNHLVSHVFCLREQALCKSLFANWMNDLLTASLKWKSL